VAEEWAMSDALQTKFDQLLLDRDALLDGYQQVLAAYAGEILRNRSRDSIADWFLVSPPIVEDVQTTLWHVYKQRRADRPVVKLVDDQEAA
jgi:hypothetical protein